MSPVYTAKEGCSEAAGGSIKNHYWTNTTRPSNSPPLLRRGVWQRNHLERARFNTETHARYGDREW